MVFRVFGGLLVVSWLSPGGAGGRVRHHVHGCSIIVHAGIIG